MKRISFKNLILLMAIAFAFMHATAFGQETGPAGSVMRVPAAGGKARLGPVDLSSANSTTGRMDAQARLNGFVSGACLFGGSGGLLNQETSTACFWDDANNSLGLGTGTISSKAILQLNSTSKGFLLPRMTTAQRTAITSPDEGLFVFDTDLNQAFQYTGTAWEGIGSHLGTATALDASAAFQVDSTSKGALSAPRMTTSQRDAITSPATGLQVYNTDTNALNYYNGTLWKAVGSGSGGGGDQNFIANGDAEDQINIFTVSKNTVASARPDVGFVTTGVTISASVPSTGPPNAINGLKSFLLTKPASNAQGQQWYVPFNNLPEAYNAKVLTINTKYRVASGTFVPGTTGSSATDGDLIVYMAVLNPNTAQWEFIEPSSIKFLSNSTTLSDTIQSTFQTPKEGSAYRLIYHVASTSALAWGLQVDDIQVSPSKYVYGTPITDWETYNAAPVTPLSNATYTGKKRRVGSNVEIFANVYFTGAPTAAQEVYFGLGGLSIDTASLSHNGSNVNVVGQSTIIDAGVNTYTGIVTVRGSNTELRAMVDTASGSFAASASLNTSNTPFAFGSGDIVFIKAEVPIVGWSSSVQMSDSADTRTVAYTGYAATNTSINNSPGNINLTTITDSHGAYSSGNGYVIPVAGYYKIWAGANVSSGNVNATVRINVTSQGGLDLGSVYLPSGPQSSSTGGTIILNLKAGEVVSYRPYVGAGTGTLISSAGSGMSIERLTGPSAIAASETVAVSYRNLTGQSIPHATITTITGWTKYLDTHNSFNPTTGIFTAPLAGTYEFSGGVTFAAASWIADVEISMFAGGSLMGVSFTQASGTYNITASGTILVPMTAGQSFAIGVFQGGGTTRSMRAAAPYNWLNIKRIGM